ncbi:MAG: response regulator [Candidatus Zixiibacteriota bacterium]
MSEKRILFIHDHPDILPELKKLAGRMHDEWDINYISGDNEAYVNLTGDSYTIVVSGIFAPSDKTVILLKKVKETFPGSVRFVFAGQLPREIILKSVGDVHQYLNAPCSADTFLKQANNSIGLRDLLMNSELQTRIASIETLPSPPEIYNQLILALQSENTSIQKIAELISKDISITAKLLQMINSACFGLPHRVESTLYAVNLLGLDTVRSLVLAAGLFNQFRDPRIPGFSIERIYSASLAVGSRSRLIAHAFGLDRRLTEDALMAGMLHDIGKLVLLSNFQEELTTAVKLADDRNIPLYQAEKEILGVSDAEIGAYLLSLWGLPDNILEAVALHYRPQKAKSPMINVLTSVHLAFAINYDQTYNIKKEGPTAVDLEYLTRLNLAEQLPSLRDFCMAAV